MSANHARRRRTGQAEVADLARRRTEKAISLIALRERLAVTVAEYEAHDLDGATDLLQQMLDVEAAVKAIAPRVYEQRWIDWIHRDAELAHNPGDRHPECGVCKLLALQLNPALPRPGRAS